MTRILEQATITSKGQITLPKSIRQALDADAGAKLAFEWDGSQVIVRRADAPEHADPAIKGLLAILERDIAAGRNLGSLPTELREAMQAAAEGAPEPDDEIEGPVAL